MTRSFRRCPTFSAVQLDRVSCVSQRFRGAGHDSRFWRIEGQRGAELFSDDSIQSVNRADASIFLPFLPSSCSRQSSWPLWTMAHGYTEACTPTCAQVHRCTGTVEARSRHSRQASLPTRHCIAEQSYTCIAVSREREERTNLTIEPADRSRFFPFAASITPPSTSNFDDSDFSRESFRTRIFLTRDLWHSIFFTRKLKLGNDVWRKAGFCLTEAEEIQVRLYVVSFRWIKCKACEIKTDDNN